MHLSYCGRKAISRSPLPEWSDAGAGMVTFSNLYLVLRICVTFPTTALVKWKVMDPI